MTIDETIYDTLGAVATHVYPDSIPLNAAFPLIVYKRVTTLRERSHDGTALIRPRYQFTCWAQGPTAARALARDVIELYESDLTCQIENHLEPGFTPDQKLYSVIVEVRFAAYDETALV